MFNSLKEKREYFRLKQREYRKKNKDHCRKVRRKYIKKTRKRINELARIRRAKNKEKYREKNRIWKEENKDRYKELQQKYVEKMKKNKVYKREYKRWEDWEINFIKDNYNNLSVSNIARHLNRGKLSTRRKIENLGIRLYDAPRNKNYFWSYEEILVVKKNINKTTEEIKELLPNRSIYAIQHKIKEILRS